MDSVLGGYCEEYARGRQHDLADLVVNGDVQNLWWSVRLYRRLSLTYPVGLRFRRISSRPRKPKPTATGVTILFPFISDCSQVSPSYLVAHNRE